MSGKVRWTFTRLDCHYARLQAAAEPWFLSWFRRLLSGAARCLHCGRIVDSFGGLQAAMVGHATVEARRKRRQKNEPVFVIITICEGCAFHSASLEEAAHWAVDAADAAIVTDGRSFDAAIADTSGRLQ